MKTLNGIIGFAGFISCIGTLGSIENDLIDFKLGSIIALISILISGYTTINYNYNKAKGKW